MRRLARRLAGRRAEPLPIVLCIDVEPDEREISGGAEASWNGLRGLEAREPETRARLERASGRPVSFNWFLRADPQIADVAGDHRHLLKRSAALWRELAARGDELGVHSHAWRSDGRGGSLIDHGDAAWVAHCAGLGLSAYREHFGVPAPSFRGGDRFLSAELVDLLDREGVGVDLTVEPGMPAVDRLSPDERSTGRIPDYTAAPLDPFHPDRPNWLRPGGEAPRGLMLVPLTPGEEGTLALWAEPDEFSAGLAARMRRGEPRHLAFAIRADLAQWDNAWERMLVNLEGTLSALGRGGGRFVAASELARELHAAGAGNLSRP